MFIGDERSSLLLRFIAALNSTPVDQKQRLIGQYFISLLKKTDKRLCSEFQKKSSPKIFYFLTKKINKYTDW